MKCGHRTPNTDIAMRQLGFWFQILVLLSNVEGKSIMKIHTKNAQQYVAFMGRFRLRGKILGEY